mmetsp:Transcript_29152/g.77826  ORF Transcript_29152/g.77826 Transcript_29152/m.77826 type:complete len:235 (-) Transcript_29152:969-1673(-)
MLIQEKLLPLLRRPLRCLSSWTFIGANCCQAEGNEFAKIRQPELLPGPEKMNSQSEYTCAKHGQIARQSPRHHSSQPPRTPHEPREGDIDPQMATRASEGDDAVDASSLHEALPPLQCGPSPSPLPWRELCSSTQPRNRRPSTERESERASGMSSLPSAPLLENTLRVAGSKPNRMATPRRRSRKAPPVIMPAAARMHSCVCEPGTPVVRSRMRSPAKRKADPMRMPMPVSAPR